MTIFEPNYNNHRAFLEIKTNEDKTYATKALINMNKVVAIVKLKDGETYVDTGNIQYLTKEPYEDIIKAFISEEIKEDFTHD